MSSSADNVLDPIFARFSEDGHRAYLGESLSLAEHMLQTAHAAEQDGAPPTLVAAGLLHDFGYLVEGATADPTRRDADQEHAEIGYVFLAKRFVPAVVEPIRRHVAAKRYLCAVDPDYLRFLSPASLRTLAVQGGPYRDAEVRAFEASAFAQDAIRLRHYDDRAKVPGARTPDLRHYRSLLEAHLLSRRA